MAIDIGGVTFKHRDETRTTALANSQKIEAKWRTAIDNAVKALAPAIKSAIDRGENAGDPGTALTAYFNLKPLGEHHSSSGNDVLVDFVGKYGDLAPREVVQNALEKVARLLIDKSNYTVNYTAPRHESGLVHSSISIKWGS
jgi:hypothetical protein